MENRERQLVIVNFAPRFKTVAFCTALGHLDFGYSIVDGRSWLVDCAPVDHRSLVIFLGDDLNSYSAITETLKKNKLIPNLVIFPHVAANWDKTLIDFSFEFLGWPCTENELALRLQRVCYDPDPLTRDFAELQLIGNSPAFLESLNLINKISQCEAQVLIEGETGTGKELAARAIHYLSERKNCPFVPVNCGAIPDSLIENELFGHVKGAYTDAKDNQPGLIDMAEGGTLFLDEINSLSAKGQITLLRFLEDKQFKSLGGRNVTRADIRVIAASNVRLSQLLSEGGFREDLYFRLNTISLELPSLRDRTGDIELLAEHFLRHCQAVYDKPAKILHPQLVDWLKRQEWKGNIRQLENFIHQQFLLTDGQVIRPPNPKGEQTNRAQEEYEDSHMSGTFSDLKAQVIKEFEVNYLSRLLNETNGNVTLAAKRAGKERRALGKLLKKYSIDSNKYRNSF